MSAELSRIVAPGEIGNQRFTDHRRGDPDATTEAANHAYSTLYSPTNIPNSQRQRTRPPRSFGQRPPGSV